MIRWQAFREAKWALGLCLLKGDSGFSLEPPPHRCQDEENFPPDTIQQPKNSLQPCWQWVMGRIYASHICSGGCRRGRGADVQHHTSKSANFLRSHTKKPWAPLCPLLCLCIQMRDALALVSPDTESVCLVVPALPSASLPPVLLWSITLPLQVHSCRCSGCSL